MKHTNSVSTCLLGILLLGLWTAPTAAQTAILKGNVVESETGQTLPGVNIVLQTADVKKSTTTSLQGQFEIRGIKPDTYTVTVSCVGFAEKVVNDVVLNAGQTRVLEISLVSAPISLNPILVTASRRKERNLETPAAVSLVDKTELESRPTLTPTEHVKGLPGVDVVSTGLNQDRMVVRGFNDNISGRLLILVDNRFSQIPNLPFNIEQLIPANDQDIERIEVVAGPGSALYGPNSAGGLMHIITKSPFDSKGTSLSLGIGERSLLTGSIRHAGTLNKWVGYKISGKYIRGEDWETVDAADPDSITLGISTPQGRTPIGEKIPNTRDFGIQNIGVDAQLDFRFDNGAEAILSAGYADIDDIELGGPSSIQARGWSYSYLQGRFVHGNLFAQAYLLRDDSGDSYLLRDGNRLIDRSIQIVAQVQHGFALMNNRQRFTYGTDLILDRPETEGTIHGLNENDNDVNGLGVYLQSATRLSPKWKAILAGRIDESRLLDRPVFSPRAALIFKPDANHHLRFTFNRAFQGPDISFVFRDIKLASSIGPFPYGLHFTGIPPDTGYNFRRNADGGIGGLYMQSPFNPEQAGGRAARLPADATLMWNAALNFARRFADVPDVPAPNSEQVGTVLAKADPNNPGSFIAATPDDVIDFAPLDPARTTTYEIGYKGVLKNKVFFFANLYNEKDINFSNIARIETPHVFLDSASLAAYLETFMPATQAQALAGRLAGVPLGVVTPEEGPAADMILTGGNVGEVSFYGAEFGLTYYTDQNWKLGGTYSYVSRNFFKRRANETDDNALNIPKHKMSAKVGYETPDKDFSAHLRVRYVDSFPIISIAGKTTIDAYSVVDLTATYRFPFYGNPALTLSVQNLLNNKHREYIKAAEIGRVGLLRLSYFF